MVALGGGALSYQRGTPVESKGPGSQRTARVRSVLERDERRGESTFELGFEGLLLPPERETLGREELHDLGDQLLRHLPRGRIFIEVMTSEFKASKEDSK